jgi:hypothetical protein
MERANGKAHFQALQAIRIDTEHHLRAARQPKPADVQREPARLVGRLPWVSRKVPAKMTRFDSVRLRASSRFRCHSLGQQRQG